MNCYQTYNYTEIIMCPFVSMDAVIYQFIRTAGWILVVSYCRVDYSSIPMLT